MHTLKCTSPLSSDWVGELVGSKFACVLCQRVIIVVRMLFVNVAVIGENLQGSLPAPGAVAALEEQSTREPQARAAGASCWPL